GDRQDHVLRRASQGARADAARAQGGACGHRSVQPAVLRLSRTAGRRGQCGGQIAVLEAAALKKSCCSWMRLDPRASAAGVRLSAHGVLGSPNAEALRLASQGERGPLWVTAARQTAGRGRRGRRWVSEPGNLYASLLLTDPAPAAHWPQISFVAAL